MADSKPTVVVTGISGNLGLRLLPLLSDFHVIGLDLHPPQTHAPVQFIQMDLGDEDSCRQLMTLLRESQPVALIHLAFVLDPVRTGILDEDRMWRINVGGIARIMEALAETNRYDAIVGKFIVPSSVAVYGPSLPQPVTEDAPMAARALPYAIYKMEAERVIQQRVPSLRGCSAYVLRPHIFAGSTVENYMIGAFRGTPNGTGPRAVKMRKQGKRLPCMLPMGKKYLQNKIQFVHVDDMARLIAYILRRDGPEAQRLTMLNVSGRGQALTFERCIAIAKAKLVSVPGKMSFQLALEALWKLGISAVPPAAMPYMTGEYIMNTDRLREFLGPDYETVIRFTVEQAFQDSFPGNGAPAAASPQPH